MREVSVVWEQIRGTKVLQKKESIDEIDTKMITEEEQILAYFRNAIAESYNVPDDEVSIKKWCFTDTNDKTFKLEEKKEEVVEDKKEEAPLVSQEEINKALHIKKEDNIPVDDRKYRKTHEFLNELPFKSTKEAFHFGCIVQALSEWGRAENKDIVNIINEHIKYL